MQPFVSFVDQPTESSYPIIPIPKNPYYATHYLNCKSQNLFSFVKLLYTSIFSTFLLAAAILIDESKAYRYPVYFVADNCPRYKFSRPRNCDYHCKQFSGCVGGTHDMTTCRCYQKHRSCSSVYRTKIQIKALQGSVQFLCFTLHTFLMSTL